jgi:hypothetical protein
MFNNEPNAKTLLSIISLQDQAALSCSSNDLPHPHVGQRPWQTPSTPIDLSQRTTFRQLKILPRTAGLWAPIRKPASRLTQRRLR